MAKINKEKYLNEILTEEDNKLSIALQQLKLNTNEDGIILI